MVPPRSQTSEISSGKRKRSRSQRYDPEEENKRPQWSGHTVLATVVGMQILLTTAVVGWAFSRDNLGQVLTLISGSAPPGTAPKNPRQALEDPAWKE